MLLYIITTYKYSRLGEIYLYISIFTYTNIHIIIKITNFFVRQSYTTYRTNSSR